MQLGKLYRLKLEKNYNIFVIVGDGEINEGSVWESALIASKHKLNNLKVILDYNKIQSYGKTTEVLDLEPLKPNGRVLVSMLLRLTGMMLKI